MTDFRALCAELADNLERYQCWYIEDNGYGISDLEALLRRASTALAQPKPQGPTDEDLWELYDDMGGDPEDCAWCSTYARAVLARWGRPAIEPVPVAERLPGPEDCDAGGCCWVASEDCPAWHRVSRHFDAWHYWLPHHALPVPQQEADRG